MPETRVAQIRSEPAVGAPTDAQDSANSGPGTVGRESVGREGVWQMRTERSGYRIDLDAWTLTRLPRQGAGLDPQDPGANPRVMDLRRDGEPVPPLALGLCALGQRAVFLLDVRGDGLDPLAKFTRLEYRAGRLTLGRTIFGGTPGVKPSRPSWRKNAPPARPRTRKLFRPRRCEGVAAVSGGTNKGPGG